MKFASTFLSHSSEDKKLVTAVANELGKYGVIPWLDTNELRTGMSLQKALKKSIDKQMTFTIFLSKDALKSSWVEEELLIALNRVEDEHILPVYLEGPRTLVESSELLSKLWMTNRKKIDCLWSSKDEKKSIPANATTIAQKIAVSVFARAQLVVRNEILICLDQRGNGDRFGEPIDIPNNLKEKDIPTLVFRPNMYERSQDEVLNSKEFDKFTKSIKWALKSFHPKKIHICGNAQLPLAYFLGNLFNRSTYVHLFCVGREGEVFNNKDQLRDSPLDGGSPHCETKHPDIHPLPNKMPLKAVSLILGQKTWVNRVLNYFEAMPDLPPPIWVANGRFKDNQAVMDYLKDVIALLLRLNKDHGIRKIYLFCGLPFSVIPLLAANLLYVVDNLVFMEYRKDLPKTDAVEKRRYLRLPMT